ncbi:MAG: Sapep family Mn(2+)-dependent dipeptidase, partial [Oscillospiraceae bacterium]
VSCPSVYKKEEGFLFGRDIDSCLDKALEIMKGLGFKTFKAKDGAYGYAEIGEGEMFAVLGHLDVVNARAEDGWVSPPFEATVRDNALYGRGTQDDKGPMVTAIYALKSLLDDGGKLKKRVRFIFGLDEETLWRSIAQYTKREQTPSMGFTPDSAFPLTYAEKGLLQVLIKNNQKPPIEYQGGDSFNAVSSYAKCSAEFKIEKALEELGYKYHSVNGKLEVEGKTAHAKNPWKGTNANLRLLEALKKAGYTDNAIEFACDILKDKFKFEGFSKEDLSDFSGPVTTNLGKILAKGDETVFSVDFRLPVGMDKDKIFTIIKDTAARYELTVEEYDWLRPIHVPLESELVQNLLSAYQEITGDTAAQPYISAGATYARAFDNCVAFGANMPGCPTSEHQPNENISLDNVMKSFKIYRRAFEKCVME